MAVMQITRTSVAGGSPVAGSLQPGQLAVEMATPTRLWVGVPNTIDPAMQKKLFDNGPLPAAIDDAAAATAGVPLYGWYQNAGAMRQRLV